jgi:hypothetical protein
VLDAAGVVGAVCAVAKAGASKPSGTPHSRANLIVMSSPQRVVARGGSAKRSA